MRYGDFVWLAWRTPFYRDDSEENNNNNNNNNKIQSVLLQFLPAALFKFGSYMAVQQVLRYALLLHTVGVSAGKLALTIGLVDACLSGLDVMLRFQGSWDAYKAKLVSRMAGPWVCLGLYLGGVAVCVGSAIIFGYRGPIPDLALAISVFTIGAWSMQIAQNTVWNIWAQVVKRQANKRLKEERTNLSKSDDNNGSNNSNGSPTGGSRQQRLALLDFQGKMAQFQVMIRYLAISVAPLTATYVLNHTNNSAPWSYVIISSYYVMLCVLVAIPVHGLLQRGLLKGDSKTKKEATTTQNGGKNDENGGKNEPEFVMQWYEMMPSWCGCLKSNDKDKRDGTEGTAPTERDPLQQVVTTITSAATTSPTIPRHARSRYCAAFFNLGIFSCATEVVRGGFLRVLCLRVAISTATVSVSALGHILAVVGATSVLLFWLSDVADSNRRLAAAIGFSLLSAGHWVLGLSTTVGGFYVAAVLFGIGEGFFTGLRELVKQDYLDTNGPLGDLSRDMAGYVSPVQLRRQLVNKTQVWKDATMIVNSLVLGLVGNFFGMAVAACVFGVLGLCSTLFVLAFMLDTKPNVMRSGSLWSNLVHDCSGSTVETDDNNEKQQKGGLV